MTGTDPDLSTPPSAPDTAGPRPVRRYRPGSLELLGLILVAAIVLQDPLAAWVTAVLPPGWATVFIAIVVQATPFLVIGVLVSALIAAFVPASFFRRVLPDRPSTAVPLAGACGIVLPGCECGSVPIAHRLMDRGVRPSAALAFLLSAPAINPIVLVATAVAFPGDLSMMWARLVAGLLTAVLVGWLWERFGRREWMRPRLRTSEQQGTGWGVLVPTMRAEFTQACGFLVLGAAAAATLNTVVPRSWMEHVGSSLLLSVLMMALLAFLLALCSESDAFVAASFSTIPVVGKLVFLTVGPAVDVKLVMMQSGTFGRRFAVRFAPLTFVVAVAVAVVVGLIFWGPR